MDPPVLSRGYAGRVYIEPSEEWLLENAQNLVAFGGVHVRYIAAGYITVKFESVPVQSGKVVVSPDVTLIPLKDEWVFYTDESASMRR